MSRRARRARSRDRNAGTAVVPARAISTFGSGSYTGARVDRRALMEWLPRAQSADADIIGDLPMLRARSRDLARNTPIAGGAIETVVTCAVGTGLRPQPRIDRDYLQLSEDEADDWERQIVRHFRFVAESTQLDVAGTHTFPEQQAQVVRTTLESGDVVMLRRRKPTLALPIGLAWQLIEADRVTNPLGVFDRPGFVAGVETDDDGAPVAYHVASHYPDDFIYSRTSPLTWKRIPALGEAGRMALHLAWRRRPNQTRGVPYLAACIEPLKQLARYGDAELMAAVIGALFTVFIKSEHGDLLGAGASSGTDATGQPLPPNYRLGEAAILNLLPGEDITIADPKRPNAAYDPFVLSKLKECGVALQLPFEVLIKSFQASFSASRASQLEAWRFYYCVRAWLARGHCQPTYEGVISECVALGLLPLKNFFEDPLARYAWLGCEWVGDAPGELDPGAAADAAEKRIRIGISTRQREAALVGVDWETEHAQAVKEKRMRQRDGLEDANGATSPAPVSGPPAKTATERDTSDAQEQEASRAA